VGENAVPRLATTLPQRKADGSVASRANTYEGDTISSLHNRSGFAGITCLNGSSDRLGELLTGVPRKNFGRPSGIRVRHL
jgi:hypothetical protein